MDEQKALKFSAEASQLYRDGKIEASISSYKKALELYGDDNVAAKADILLQMGDMYLEVRDPESAGEHYQLALKSYKRLKIK